MRIRKFVCLLLALTLPAAAAAEGLTLLDDLAGTVYWPSGSDAGNAVYTYTYRYPQVAGDGEAESTINALYEYQVNDAMDFTIPIRGESIADPSQQARTEISYRLTANNSRFFSILFTSDTVMDGSRQVIYSAQTFSRNTRKPGNVITLPYLLGILAEDETDEWLKDRQTNRANTCVRTLIRDEIGRRARSGLLLPGEFLDEDLEYSFYPEEDFYYDEALDAVVFFLQPYLFGQEALSDSLLFPFTVEEILDEL